MFEHRLVPADASRVPKPFRSFAVRSDEPQHAWQARNPYARVHVVHTGLVCGPALAGLVAQAYARVDLQEAGAVDYAATTVEDVAAAAAQSPELPACIAEALLATGVLGGARAVYAHHVAARIDYLACRGAGFHNDVRGASVRPASARPPECLSD